MFKSLKINKAVQSLGVLFLVLTLTALLAACGDTATPVATTTATTTTAAAVTTASSAVGAVNWTQVQLSDALQTLVKKRFPGIAGLTGAVAVSNDDVATVITSAKTTSTGYTCTLIADGSNTGGPSVLGCTSANLDIVYQFSPITDASLNAVVENLPDDIAKLKTAATGKKTLVQIITGTGVVKTARAIIAAGGVVPVTPAK